MSLKMTVSSHFIDTIRFVSSGPSEISSHQDRNSTADTLFMKNDP